MNRKLRHKYFISMTTFTIIGLLFFPIINGYTTSSEPHTISIKWSYSINGGRSSPEVTNDKAYITSYETIYCFKTVNSVNPTVFITFPENGDIINGTINITGSANSPTGNVTIVQIKIDEGDWKTCTGTTSWSYEWESNSVPDGHHKITARCYDGVEFSDSYPVFIWVNNDGGNVTPNVFITYPYEYDKVNGITTITGNAEDVDGEIELVRIKIKDEDWQICTGTTDWSYEWDTHNTQNGWLTICAQSFDGEDYSLTHCIDVYNEGNAFPTVEITYPRDGAIVNRKFILVEGIANDQDDDEIEWVKVRVDDGIWQTCEGTNEWSIELDISELKWKHTISAISYDSKDTSEIDEITIYICRPPSRETMNKLYILSNALQKNVFIYIWQLLNKGMEE